jgi:hypothetical protein
MLRKLQRPRALRHADGSLEVSGELYRLRELGADQLEVRTFAGDKVLGRLELPEQLGKGTLRIVNWADEASRRVLRAIARLMSAPRGMLPIQ